MWIRAVNCETLCWMMIKLIMLDHNHDWFWRSPKPHFVNIYQPYIWVKSLFELTCICLDGFKPSTSKALTRLVKIFQHLQWLKPCRSRTCEISHAPSLTELLPAKHEVSSAKHARSCTCQVGWHPDLASIGSIPWRRTYYQSKPSQSSICANHWDPQRSLRRHWQLLPGCFGLRSCVAVEAYHVGDHRGPRGTLDSFCVEKAIGILTSIAHNHWEKKFTVRSGPPSSELVQRNSGKFYVSNRLIHDGSVGMGKW